MITHSSLDLMHRMHGEPGGPMPGPQAIREARDSTETMGLPPFAVTLGPRHSGSDRRYRHLFLRIQRTPKCVL